jgi:hypothetical protein
MDLARQIGIPRQEFTPQPIVRPGATVARRGPRATAMMPGRVAGLVMRRRLDKMVERGRSSPHLRLKAVFA